METFEEDRRVLHRMIGLPYTPSNGGFNTIKDVNKKSSFSTQQWTTHYFKNISLEAKQKLVSIYRYDFELFGYDKELY